MRKKKTSSVRLPSHVYPTRYELLLKPDFDKFTFTGEETIHLSLEKPTKQITLHAIEFKIKSAKWINSNEDEVHGKISLDRQIASFAYNKKNETATFTFPEILPKGRGELKIVFKGTLNDKMRGFYRSKYEVNGVSKYLATTQFESTDARRAFPCFDEPALKAIFDVSLIIPSKMTAISNTVESEVREYKSGLKLVKFSPTPKMSTYLLAFIVGEFEYIEGGRGLVRVFTTPGKKEQGKFALDVAIKCMDFYENYFGIKYTLPVLDMIAIPDFTSGAMENWGAVTYRESTLLVDEEKSSVGNKQWVALVIAHELAHQWFGNLVTMEWWTHLWLNEGFASFIEYLAIDDIFPEWDIWTQFVANEMGVALSLDALKNTHPIEVEVNHPAEISEIFDKVSYSKGSSILRMLYAYLGPKYFQKGLHYYLKKHAYSNTKTEDLWIALEHVSGKPVAKVMKNWTSKAGHPLIRVKGEGERGKLELKQSRFFSSSISKKQSKDKTIWEIPIKIQNSKGKMQNYILKSKNLQIDISKAKDWIKFNWGEESFVRVRYPQELLKQLEEAVKENKISPADRLALVRDVFALAQAGDSSTVSALELARSYKDEDDYTVWLEITNHLSQLDSLLAFESFYESYRRYGCEIYRIIANKLGWEKRIGEKHTDSLSRGIVLYKLGFYGDRETIAHAQKIFKDAKVLKIDPDLRGVVYQLIAENGGKEEFNTFIDMYKREDNQQEKDRIGRTLGRFQNFDLLSQTLEFAISNDVRYQNSLQIIASAWSNPKGRYLAWEFVRKNWKLLKSRYAGAHFFTRVFIPAGEFTRKKDARDLETFVKKNPIPEAKRTIAQALEQIHSNVAWLERDSRSIENFLVVQ